MILYVLALTSAGLLVGNELAIAVFVHPVLSRQADVAHFPAATALAKLLGRVMPFWYALVVLLTASVLTVAHHQAGRWPPLIAASLALWILSIVYTVTTLVPINNRIAAWTADTRPADWKSFRSRWDLLHRWRVFLLAAAFLLLEVGILR